MTNYIIRRTVMAIVIIWVISIVVFLLLRVGPGNPALLQQGINATPAKIAQVNHELHLDEPYPEQYGRWLKGLVTFNFGTSPLTQTNITTDFESRFPVTFQLMIMTVLWTIILGIPFGVLSAYKRNSGADYSVRLFAIFGLSVPNFWVATLVLLIPNVLWHYAPPLDRQVAFFSAPWDNLKQFGPPSLVLALGPIAGIMRLARSSLLEVLRADYVRTARAKGLAERAVIVRHALKNSLIPVITVLGLQIATLMGGAVIIEVVFNLRGLGQYIYTAILAKEFNIAQTLVVYTAAAAVFMNLVIDLVYGLFDPRIRYA